MKLFNSAIIAFSMYSKIPMPRVDWNKENMKYVMCFFPLVGIANGLLMIFWLWICSYLKIGNVLMSAVCMLIPLIVTGGIHLDGYCDTIDGLSSHQSIEKKLQILQDPNSGAFAVIGCVAYLVLNVALWSEMPLNRDAILIVALSYVLTRSLSGLSIVTFKMAKTSGLAASFSDLAQKKKVKITMIIFVILIDIFMLMINLEYGIAVSIVLSLVFIYYKIMSYKQFGGITGDLAGFFLQLAEISVLLSLVAVNKLI
ncbi:MAG: adenosylcobinamide-GDP ribazoletransferase [Oscillospiraceae bacterium]